MDTVCYQPRLLPGALVPGQPITALAPMQDVTTLAFMSIVSGLGPPDYFFTEYFRVHEHSRLEKHILESITQNPSGRPVFAQLIGECLPHMKRTVQALSHYPIAGVDLNMGCPAPKVYKKQVGGGLLRDLSKVDSLLGYLREHVPGLFTVKMRIGFDGTDNFEALLGLINKHGVDLLSLHGRTVAGMYRTEVDYEKIKQAAQTVRCPVLANGNISSVEKTLWVLNFTGAFGVMIGRSAIRNPWIFRQLRECFAGNKAYFRPIFRDVYNYIEKLYESVNEPEMTDRQSVAKMKKYLNFIGLGVDPEGSFLKEIRRVMEPKELFDVAYKHLLEDGRERQLFATEAFEGLVARPNREC